MKNKPNPLHQKETEWIGPVYFFECDGLSPDDPEFKRRAANGRAADAVQPSPPKKSPSKKPKK